jgi:hypothetical protein
MPIRGHVGRHAKTGRHCQNWKSDQQVVIALLNRISVDKGGAEGSLGGRVVAGLASYSLYQAILRFQKQYYGRNQTGFIAPGSQMLAWMETLAGLPPAPRPPRQWNAIKTRSVMTAINKASDDDRMLSHADVVNIVRSTLSDGIVSINEVDDLQTVSTTSRSISPRSRKMLDTLIYQIRTTFLGNGPYELMLHKHQQAADVACGFLERSGAGRFPYLDRDHVGVGMLMRIANPGMIDQGPAGLCGPAALLFGLAYDDPVAYARFVIELYENGKAALYHRSHRGSMFAASEGLRQAQPPQNMNQVDWMTMASIRDSENIIRVYNSASDSGGTTDGELARWFERAGYSDVRNETNAIFSKGIGTIDSANQLFSQGYRICLYINSNMLHEKRQSTEGRRSHVVVLRSPIDRSGGKIRLKVFTWGEGDYQIPHGTTDLSVDDFLDNFYGYVAGKPY